MGTFDNLLRPGYINRLKFDNRVIMSPIASNLVDASGSPTDAMSAFYLERARGGTGALLLENANVDYPKGKNGATQLRLDSIDYIPGLNRLINHIKLFCGFNIRIGVQINHAGSLTSSAKTGGFQPVAPSAVPAKLGMECPIELKKEDIELIIEKYADGASRAKKAGFDFVEIHGGHGYLIDNFLSPYNNRRSDEYGDTFEGRLKFAIDIIHRTRQEVGKDYPLSFRLCCSDFVEGGRDLDWAKNVAIRLEEAGVDAITASAGTPRFQSSLTETFSYTQGWRVYLAEEMKKVVRIPVITVGVIREPEFAESVIREGRADFVAIGRGLVADPYWVMKATKGKSNEINRCISCNICTKARAVDAVSLRCTVNPEVGNEINRRMTPEPSTKKKVMVIGGGAAGMYASILAAQKGHDVILYEKSKSLGGQFKVCTVPPNKEKLNWFKEYLLTMLETTGLEIRLGAEGTVEAVKREKPAVVILATGSNAMKPNITGIEGSSVFTAREVLAMQSAPKGKSIAVIGGGQVGCETTEYLRGKNNRVSIIEMLSALALDAEPIYREELLHKLTTDEGVTLYLNATALCIESNAVVVSRAEKGNARISADVVIAAVGSKPESSLEKALREENLPVKLFTIGDAKLARSLLEASQEAYWAVQNI